jgi:hypothetical protein
MPKSKGRRIHLSDQAKDGFASAQARNGTLSSARASPIAGPADDRHAICGQPALREIRSDVMIRHLG